MNYLHLEPIGLVFVFFFASVMVIQFIAMLFHRFGTLSQILASTELSCCSRSVSLQWITILDLFGNVIFGVYHLQLDDMSDEAYLEKNAVDIVRTIQRMPEVETQMNNDPVSRRQTVTNIIRNASKRNQRPTKDIEKRFRERIGSIAPVDRFEGNHDAL